MKTFLKITLVWAVVFTAMGVQATNGDLNLQVKKEQGKSIRFTLNVEQINLSIIDDYGSILFTEKVTASKTLNRTYNLNEFPAGIYYLEAETTHKVARYKITVSEKQAFLFDKALKETIKPVLKTQKECVILQIENPEKTPIEVSILDSKENEVYSATFEGVSTFNKKFDFSKLNGEQYTFVTSYNNKFFVDSIAIK